MQIMKKLLINPKFLTLGVCLAVIVGCERPEDVKQLAQRNAKCTANTVSKKTDEFGRTDFMMRSDKGYTYAIKCGVVGKNLIDGDTVVFEIANNGNVYARNLSDGTFSQYVVKKIVDDSILTESGKKLPKSKKTKAKDTLNVRDWDLCITEIHPYIAKRGRSK